MILTLPDNWSDNLRWLIGFNWGQGWGEFSSLYGRTRFATGSSVSTKVTSSYSTETGRYGCYQPQCLHFKEMAFRDLRNTFLHHKADKGPSSFQKD